MFKIFLETLSFTCSEKVIVLKIFFWIFHLKKYHCSGNIYKDVFKYKKVAIDRCSINRSNCWRCSIKGPLSDLRRLLIVERPLKMNTNTVCFMLKDLFVLEISKFFSWIFGYVENQLDKKAIVNLKVFDVTDCTTNNYNTNITQYFQN